MTEKERLKKVASSFEFLEIGKRLGFYKARSLMPFVSGPDVSEVGCSIGIVTEQLASKFSVTVVEGSEEYANCVKSIAKKVYSCLFEDFQTQERFDDIVMTNILEHVEDPVFFLKKAKSLLKDNGRIHIMVPNAESLHRRIGKIMGKIESLNSFSENDFKIGHRRVYNREKLKQDVEGSGLRVAKDKGVFLKPLSHSQINNLGKEIWDAFFEIGKELPSYCSIIYFICQK